MFIQGSKENQILIIQSDNAARLIASSIIIGVLMSTVLYSNGWLVTDSGGITEQYDTHLFVPTNINKLAISTCRTVAAGISGKALIYANIINSIVDQIAIFLKDNDYELSSSTDVCDYFKKIAVDNKADFTLLIINTIDYHIYEISCEIKEDTFIFNVKTIRNTDIQSIGSGSFFAYAAISLGFSPIDAVKQAIKYDQFSRLPIRSVSINDLVKYIAEDKS